MDDLTLHVYEGPVADTVTTGPGGLGVFASDIGLPVGFWPWRLRLPGFPDFTRAVSRIDHDGEGWVEYVTAYGPAGPIHLRVFND